MPHSMPDRLTQRLVVAVCAIGAGAEVEFDMESRKITMVALRDLMQVK